MLDWMARNTEILSLAVNVAMLAVWLSYLQVFLKGYRRQVRPKLVINRGAGTGLTSRCFISNMGSDAIYLEDILVHVCCGEKEWRGSVLDVRTAGNGEDTEPKSLSHQGSLRAGDYTVIGAYRDLADHVLKEHDAPALDELLAGREPVSLRVEVLADHAADDLLIGARRRFQLEPTGGEWRLAPVTLETEQVRSRRARRRLEKRFAQELGVAEGRERS